MRHYVILVAASLAVPALAQTPVPGDPVRITAPSLGFEKEIGSLVRVSPDSLTYRRSAAPGDSLTIATSSITRLEIAFGNKQQRRIGHGALVGLGIGAGLGLIAGVADGDPTCEKGGYCVNAGVSIAALGALGAAIGTIVGVFVKAPAWRQVDPAKIGTVADLRIIPSWEPSQRRAGIAVSLRF